MDRFSAASMELAQWRARWREVEAALHEVEQEEARATAELAKVDEQASYYDSLAGEMKRDLQPPSLSRLLRTLHW
jgi:hypothetical protein